MTNYYNENGDHLSPTPVRDKIVGQIRADMASNLKTQAIIITEKEYHDLNKELHPFLISQYKDNWHKAFHLHGHKTVGRLNGAFIAIPEPARMSYQALFGIAVGINIMGVLNAITDDRPVMAAMCFVGLCSGIYCLYAKVRLS